MERIVVSQLGGAEQLKLASAPEPQPGPEEVLVKIEAAGIPTQTSKVAAHREN